MIVPRGGLHLLRKLDISVLLHRSVAIRGVLSDAQANRIEAMVAQHDEILEKMSSGGASSLGKELSKLAPVAHLNEQLVSLREEEASWHELLSEGSGSNIEDLKSTCEEELERLELEKERVEQKLVEAILPKDDDDYESDAIIEVRAGTGGDEAALFAAELMGAYTKTAKAMGWRVDKLGEALTDLGGIKDAALSITGSAAYGSFEHDPKGSDPMDGLAPYGYFKFESGVHRVQRVPVNDVRVHTSACSVAILPSPKEDTTDPASLLPSSELKIETMRASGAGGQHVNTTESAVRITHIPTGITAAIQDERSQHKNKAKAMKLITARVRDKQREVATRERGAAKSSLMGGGDRSERIRTYNFPQDRVTDHRSKESEHGIGRLLAGGSTDGLIVTFAPKLREMSRDELLMQLEQSQE